MADTVIAKTGNWFVDGLNAIGGGLTAVADTAGTLTDKYFGLKLKLANQTATAAQTVPPAAQQAGAIVNPAAPVGEQLKTIALYTAVGGAVAFGVLLAIKAMK